MTGTRAWQAIGMEDVIGWVLLIGLLFGLEIVAIFILIMSLRYARQLVFVLLCGGVAAVLMSDTNRQWGGLQGSTVEMTQAPPGRKTVGVPSKLSAHASAGLGVGVADGGVGDGVGAPGEGSAGGIQFPRS